MSQFREGPPKRRPIDPGFYLKDKPKVPRKPPTPEQREQRNLRARARRAQMTPEQREKSRSRARLYRENIQGLMDEYIRSQGGASPARQQSFQGVQRGTLAHRLLQTLQSKGPQTAYQLGAGTRFGVPTGTSTQILRLLEREMIERDFSTSTYSLRDKGEEVLQALA